jgi:hypothetical protein
MSGQSLADLGNLNLGIYVCRDVRRQKSILLCGVREAQQNVPARGKGFPPK